MNNHLPVNSQLFADTIQHEHTSLIIVNLQCSAAQAGTQAPIKDTQGTQVAPGQPLVNGADDPIVGVDDQTFVSKPALDCGDSSTDKIAYIAMLLFMVATTFYQQRQMQKASPPNAASSQQQAIMKVMPLFFGFIGFTFPAGLVLYWTTSNLFQIGQQTLLLRAGHIGPDALEKRMAEQKERQASRGDAPAKKGIIGSMLARAEDERNRRDATGGKPGSKGSGTKGSGTRGSNPRGNTKGGTTKGGNTKGGTPGKGATPSKGGTPSKPTKGRPPGGTKGSTPPRGTKKPGTGSGGNGEPGS
jgi:YidC/Oxa1 family membrane protein insertase